MNSKKCSRCKNILPLENFGNNKAKKDGLEYSCRKCKKVYRDLRWEKNSNYRKTHRTEKRKYDLLRRTNNAHKHGKLTALEIRVNTPKKQCCICKKITPSSSFSTDRTMLDGLNVYCFDCYSIIKKCRTYKISPEQLQKMIEDQEGKCAICGVVEKKKSLAIDHDHKIGKNRGLLCQLCNTGLGAFKENRQILLNAITYLDKYKFLEEKCL